MKSYNIILIKIICLFSSFIFSQTTPKELMIKREIETLREEAKNSRALAGINLQNLDAESELLEIFINLNLNFQMMIC